MLNNGATTLWETWRGNINESYNHPMFGAPTEWFFRAVAGINHHPDAVGFDRIVIRPQPAGSLTWAKGEYESVRGLISSEWVIRDGIFTLTVTVPVNTTAEVHIPAASAAEVKEGRLPAADVPGIEYLRMENDAAVFGVGSGIYVFSAPRS
jgi:alpha-L-rhamnosidase